MSSGEADVITYKISNNSNWTTPTTTGYPATYYWSSYSPIYYYQVTCPKCKTLNWAELDKIITCRGVLGQERRPGGKKILCSARIKAVTEEVDYEVPVTKS